MAAAAILDLDGTLVDSNYQHAISWHRAFRRHGVTLPLWRIHRHVGMGGDQIVAALAGDDVEARLGEDVRAARDDVFGELIEEVVPLPGARELVEELGRRGLVVVIASSSPREEVDHYLDVLGVRELADDWTTADDVEATKPAPDLVRAALEKAGTTEAVLVGDTTWDCEAAGRAGIETIAVLSGGFGADELRAAGAIAVFESVDELRRRLDQTPFGRAVEQPAAGA